MRVLGLDVGEKRIGVAKADSSTRIAVPVGYLLTDGSEWRRIARLMQLNNTDCLVLGLPRSNEGAETQQSLYVRNFAKELIQQIPGAKVRFQDESLTSVVAEERLKARKRNYEKGEIDAEAAAIILQDFMEGFTSGTVSGAAAALSSGGMLNGASGPLPSDTRRFAPASQGAFKAARPSLRSSGSSPEAPITDKLQSQAKKQSDKAKLNAKKAKHKMKTATKWLTGVGVLLVIGVIAAGGAMLVKNKIEADRAAEYARLEAEMQPEVFTFTILPGETIYDIEEKLVGLGYPATEVKQALTGSYDFDFLKGRPEGATLEGYLYGETHEFYADTSVKEIIETFLTGMGEVITENNLEARYAAQGLSLYEGVTLASVVQKESGVDDMAGVARVFLNRLEYDMLLGSDVTVSYALDTVDPYRQTYGDNAAALSVDSCYNTRRNRGLPCGPISNPGLAALLAVAEPADNSYLYFLTGDDGLMYYSYTEDEHLQNAALYCSELCSVSL